jgi:hypothetical protein
VGLINEIRKSYFSKKIWEDKIYIYQNKISITASLSQLKDEKFVMLEIKQLGESIKYNLNISEAIDFSNLLTEAAKKLKHFEAEGNSNV